MYFIHQRGQALVEAILVLALLMLLGGGVATISALQWQGLEAIHLGRLYAFRYAHGERTPTPPQIRRLRAAPLASFLGPGGARALELRRDWGIEDNGIVTVYAKPASSVVRWASQSYPIGRHIALLAQSGAALSDSHIQQRIQDSNLAWRRVAQRSLRAGRRAASALQGIDSAWGRAAPKFDWLSSWSDLVTADRLQHAHFSRRAHDSMLRVGQP